MESGFAAELRKFMLEPSPERFLRLRELVAQSPEYAPYSGGLKEGRELLAQGEFEEAADFFLSVMPNWILNPGIHVMLGFAFRQLGQEQHAQLEYALATGLVGGILSTGDGSEAQPYLILHTNDEYDLLQHLEKRSQGQALRQKGANFFDVLTCEDGSELWFDVTVPLTHMQARMADLE